MAALIGKSVRCLKVLKRAHIHSLPPLSSANKYDIDIEHVFTRPDVQNLLKRITGFNINRVFRQRQIEDFDQPKYKLLTSKQLEEHTAEAIRHGQELLQMPPVKRPWSNDSEVLSTDDIADFELPRCRYVFTDISEGLKRRERCIAIREPDGTLRLANQEEKDRIFNVYYPRPGKAPKMPKMFEEQSMEKLLSQHWYEYVLDRACVQFEPDDPNYIRVTQRTYEHVATHGRFDDLRSTRHFGPMAFYYAFTGKIDGLLVDTLQRGLLTDAGDVVRLYHILHPESKSAREVQTKQVKDPEQLVSIYAQLSETTVGGVVKMALQVCLEGAEQESSSETLSANLTSQNS